MLDVFGLSHDSIAIHVTNREDTDPNVLGKYAPFNKSQRVVHVQVHVVTIIIFMTTTTIASVEQIRVAVACSQVRTGSRV